ncbi:MAG: hypothetical protein GY797_01395, partial [Deltaproteobacteria bacterium]|nr:hypothetical protein [Deltaproteobacteria bacterium]
QVAVNGAALLGGEELGQGQGYVLHVVGADAVGYLGYADAVAVVEVFGCEGIGLKK